ncbi:MAG: right-handed parallel beta-helix repeat-containing protein [Acidobacteria bacterium]|nr:right-handed parallel beta-helix repeat-containing protein [Acidobacteriota bacterium]
MFKAKFVFNTTLVFIAMISFVILAQAQSQAFVSAKNGNDANPCTVAAPCRTFNQALNAIAAGGEVVAIDSGDYQPFTVAKTATVSAAPGVSAGVVGTVSVALASTDKAVLRGLTVRGNGVASMGIYFSTPGTLYIEDCTVEGFANIGILETHSVTLGVQQLFVKNTAVRRNHSEGLLVEVGSAARSGIAKVAVENCRFEDNDRGLVIGQYSRGTVSNSVSTFNVRSGFEAVVNGTLNLDSCLSTHNNEGVTSVSTAVVRVSNCTLTDNEIGVNVEGGGIFTRKNNTVEGNTNNGAFSGVVSAK